MTLQVKICGLTNRADAHAAAHAGAAMLGFVFYPPSPRNLTIEDAEMLEPDLPEGPDRVGVFVDPDDDLLQAAIETLNLDWIQLHGDEDTKRVADIRALYSVGIIKAIPVADEGDLEAMAAYGDHVDVFLFDAKAPKGATLPGGNGVSFNWSLLNDQGIDKPWLLAGGLTIENLANAVEKSGAQAIDLSSGVESEPGKKDPALIKAFLEAASVL